MKENIKVKILIKTKKELIALGDYDWGEIVIKKGENTEELINSKMLNFSGKALDATQNIRFFSGADLYKYNAEGWGWNDYMITKILTKEENPEYFL